MSRQAKVSFGSLGILATFAGGLPLCIGCGPPEEEGLHEEESTHPLVDNAFGVWSTANNAPSPGFLATHSSLLRNDKILAVGGSSYNTCYSWGREDVRLFTQSGAGGSWSSFMAGPYHDKIVEPCSINPGFNSALVTGDAFCSGHAHDDQGRIIFQGGLRGYDACNGFGIGNSSAYTASTGVFTPFSQTAVHWYPTLVPGVRKMFLFPGRDSGGGSRISSLPYGGTNWSVNGPTQVTVNTYPRVHLLPNGKFFVSSPTDPSRLNQMYDPIANTLTNLGTNTVPAGGIYDRWNGSAVLLPLTPNAGAYLSPTVAIFNDRTAYTKRPLSGSNPAWTPTGARPSELIGTKGVRHYANSTILPNGQILITGGTNDGSDNAGQAVTETEVYDPETNSWMMTSAASAARNYHAVALLLRDGRVWSAAGSKNQAGSDDIPGTTTCDGNPNGLPNNTQRSTEIFSPWYMNESRPVLTSCPAKISTDGGTFNIGIGSSQGNNITRVALVRAGSVTHAFDSDQRHIWLEIASKNASTVTVKGPHGAPAAPPGDYMLFALRDKNATGFYRHVPSVGCWVTVEPQVVRYGITAATMNTVMSSITGQGYRPVQIDGYSVGTSTFFNVVFSKSPIAWAARWGMTADQYNTEFATRVSQGYRVTHVDSYMFGGQVQYTAIWDQSTGPATVAYHDLNETSHTNVWNQRLAEGYRLAILSVLIVGGQPRFTVVYDKAAVGSWSAWWGMTEAEYQTKVTSELAAGRRIVYINAYSDAQNIPRLTATFTQTDTGGLRANHGLTSTTLQTNYDNNISEAYQTRVIAGYASGSSARFAALWTTK